jgi:hypothetical protein
MGEQLAREEIPPRVQLARDVMINLAIYRPKSELADKLMNASEKVLIDYLLSK